MAGIGNKLLLPFDAFRHRRNGFFGAQHNNAVNQPGADNHGSNGVHGKFFNGLHFLAVVQKNSHLSMVVQLHHDVFIPAQKTISRAAILRGLEIRGQIRFRNRCDVPQIRMNQGTVFGIFQHKISSGKRSFRTEFSVLVYGLAAIFRNGGNTALIIGNHDEHFIQTMVYGNKVGRIDNQTQQEHHACYRQGGNADKAFTQTFNHVQPPAGIPTRDWRGYSLWNQWTSTFSAGWKCEPRPH